MNHLIELLSFTSFLRSRWFSPLFMTEVLSILFSPKTLPCLIPSQFPVCSSLVLGSWRGLDPLFLLFLFPVFLIIAHPSPGIYFPWLRSSSPPFPWNVVYKRIVDSSRTVTRKRRSISNPHTHIDERMDTQPFQFQQHSSLSPRDTEKEKERPGINSHFPMESNFHLLILPAAAMSKTV